MALSERQRHAELQRHAVEEDSKLLDVFNCVERLHALPLSKIVIADKGDSKMGRVPRLESPPSKVPLAKLIRALPCHVMACLLAKQPAFPPDAATAALTRCELASTSCYDHVAKALQLLSTLSNLCVPTPQQRSDGLVGPEALLTAQLVDAANMTLLAVAGPEAEATVQAAGSEEGLQAALDHASVVPAALRALALVVSAQAPELPAAQDGGAMNWQALSEALLSHPRGAVFLDAAFDAVRVLVAAVRAALCGPAPGDAVYRLAFYAGGSMEFLAGLAATPLFYHRLMLHDPHGAAPLRLVLACLALHDAPLAAPPFRRIVAPGVSPARPILAATPPPYLTDKGGGAAELLAARGFALLTLLGEYPQPAYLDQIFAGGSTKSLAEQLVGRSAGYMGQVLLRPSMAVFPPAAGEGQMSINVLRAAELLTDDSNFRLALIPGLAPTLAQLLQHQDSALFAAMWCAGVDAVRLHAGDSILVNSATAAALAGVEQHGAAAKVFFSPGGGGAGAGPAGVPSEALRLGRHLALERAVLLTKLLVNLHFHSDALGPALKDAFVHSLLAALRSGPAAGAGGLAAAAVNLRQLFALAGEFGPPRARRDLELMKDIDMELARDLLGKVAAAAAGGGGGRARLPSATKLPTPNKARPQMMAAKASPTSPKLGGAQQGGVRPQMLAPKMALPQQQQQQQRQQGAPSTATQTPLQTGPSG